MSKLNFIYKKLQNPLMKGAITYTATGLLNSLIPFLILPILTDYLSPEQYGILSTFMVLMSVFIVVIGIEQHGFISVNFFKKDRKRLSIEIFSTFLISLIVFILFSTTVFLFPNFIESLIRIEAKWVLFALGVAFLQIITQMNLSIWQLKQKPIHYGIFQVFYSLVNYGISLLFIIYFDLKEDGRIYGIALAAIFFAMTSIFILIKNEDISFKVDFRAVLDSLKFSIPLIPHGLAGWVNSGLDRLIINNYVSVADNGIYSVSYQFAMIIGLIGSSFNRAFVPVLYKKLKEKNLENDKSLVSYTYLYFIVLTIITLIVYFFTPIIIRKLISDQYHEANKYIFWIMMGFLADGFYYGVVNYIFYEKKTLYLSLVTFFVAAVHVAISYLLVPSLGPIAASYATATGYIASFLLVFLISHHIHPMPWSYPFKKVLEIVKK